MRRSRSTGTPTTSRRLLIVPASSGGKASAAQSALTPIPTIAAVTRPSSTTDSPRTPPTLAIAVAATGDEVVRPFQGEAWRAASPRTSSTAVEHRQGDDRPQAPVRAHGARSSGRNPAETRGSPGQAAPAMTCRGGRDRRSARRRPRRRPRGPRRRASRARRPASSRRDRSARAARSGCIGTARPSAVAAPRPVLRIAGLGLPRGGTSGGRPRAAASSWSSAMMQVMRISDVEIIVMLMPASASAPNIRAA